MFELVANGAIVLGFVRLCLPTDSISVFFLLGGDKDVSIVFDEAE